MKNKGYHFDVTFFYGEDDQEYRVTGFQSAYQPAVMYLSNGDPGHPAEGGEIEDFEVFKILDDGTEVEDEDDMEEDGKFMEELEYAVGESE